MIVYLVRHGQDDSTVRGGWSSSPLTCEGALQARRLAEEIGRRREELHIRRILSSDLPRAMQTAQPAADVLSLTIEPCPLFREVNNGQLAGMKNDLALARYPGLFWNTLGWEEPYPGGESPAGFAARISKAWSALTAELSNSPGNILLCTHSGVIHVSRTLILGVPYSNREKHPAVPHAVLIPAGYADGTWRLL